MEDLNDKINGGSVAASEWNQTPSELQNVIEDSGQALSSGDLNQLGKGIAHYAASGQSYTDSGAANAYVLATVGGLQSLTAYGEGQRFSFVPSADNTGAATANVSGLGVVDIKLSGGTVDPSAGAISSGSETHLIYRTSPSAHFELNTFKAVGVGQTWKDMTASRAFATTYTNTTGAPIYVKVIADDQTASGSINITLTVGGLRVDHIRVEDDAAFVTTATVGAMVPAGSTYQCDTAASDTLDKWLELR